MDAALRERLIREASEIIDGVSDDSNRYLDVLFGYRLLLQRYPEFEDERNYCVRASNSNLAGLVRTLLQSAEFRQRWSTEGIVSPPPLPDIVVMAEVDEFRFYFRLRDQAIGLSVAKGCYEPSMQALIQHLVKPGMNCIDLGANIGFLSVLMASLAGDGGTVHSFEPFPDTFALLSKNVSVNNYANVIKTYPMAAHSTAGTGNMHYRADAENDNFGSNFIANVPHEIQPGIHEAVSIQFCRVDDVVPEALPIHFVKIDVEGSETFALAGMQRILKQWHPILTVELNEYCLRNMGGVTPEDLLGLLESHGYKIFTVDDYLEGGATPYRLPLQRDRFAFDNLVCLHRNSIDNCGTFATE